VQRQRCQTFAAVPIASGPLSDMLSGSGLLRAHVGLKPLFSSPNGSGRLVVASRPAKYVHF
ncbi:MAG: hypothetical protein ABJA75_02320, partial [Bradyrhizobium sp.]